MNKDIQRAILRACSQFILRKLEPLEKRLTDIETKAIGAIEQRAQPIVKRVEALELRQPERGEKGDAGQNGKDAEPLSVSEVVSNLLGTDHLRTLIDLHVADAVAKYFEDNPVQHGRDGLQGEKGDTGPIGERGADGVGLAGAMINRDSELVITTTKGDTINLGVVVGKDGLPGSDGVDGLGFEDADVTYDGERGFTIKWQCGDKVKEKTFQVPTVIDRGYWREGTEAKAGDAMTHDGTLWIAKRDTKAKPARDSDDWRIGARKGRDGIQGPPGKDFQPSQPVKLV